MRLDGMGTEGVGCGVGAVAISIDTTIDLLH